MLKPFFFGPTTISPFNYVRFNFASNFLENHFSNGNLKIANLLPTPYSVRRRCRKGKSKARARVTYCRQHKTENLKVVVRNFRVKSHELHSEYAIRRPLAIVFGHL